MRIEISKPDLVGALELVFCAIAIGNLMIPTDKLVFFKRGRYTSNQTRRYQFYHMIRNGIEQK